jgi:hypothetical protein
MYEQYIEKKLGSKYQVVWIREAFDPRIQLQWNKMLPMSLDIDEPVVVMDIDLLLVNDYEQLFDIEVKRGEFLAMPDWWGEKHRKLGWSINGGFYKYYPSDCRYIFDKFMKDPIYWQQYYIRNKTTIGPVNGEQYFVEQSVKEGLQLRLLPNEWFTRWCGDEMAQPDLYTSWERHLTSLYQASTGNNYIYLGGQFHEDIKLVHFTHHMNKPHEWKPYSSLI